MLRLVGIVVSIGLADSLNPSTIGPALYLAAGQRARGRVAEFTIAVFGVYLVGGAAIALGPGQLLLSLIPRPRHHITDIIEISVGVAMIAGAAFLWRHRHRLADRDPPDFDPQGKSSWLLGATITAVELPTAFPYFAVIAAIVGSGREPIRQLVLLVLFNICFILPLLAIIVILTVSGPKADRLIRRWRRFLEDRWPVLLAVLGLLAGSFVVLLGATGLAASRARFIRRLHRLIHP